MLFGLLDKTCKKISKLDMEKEAPLMMREINRARPDFLERLQESGVKKNVIGLISQAIARGVLVHIKEMPTIVDIMVDRVQSRRTDPAIRCAVVGVLAYLVQPHDLIPDDAPGGYGYVDDNALLRAGLIEYLDILPPQATEAEKQRDYLQLFGSIVPLNVLPALQAAVMGVTSAFHLLRMLPSELLEITTQQAIINPLQMSAPQPPPDFTAPVAPSLGGGRWSGGAYFEGDNVIMPGGPSLIDGQLFIPD